MHGQCGCRAMIVLELNRPRSCSLCTRSGLRRRSSTCGNAPGATCCGVQSELEALLPTRHLYDIGRSCPAHEDRAGIAAPSPTAMRSQCTPLDVCLCPHPAASVTFERRGRGYHARVRWHPINRHATAARSRTGAGWPGIIPTHAEAAVRWNVVHCIHIAMCCIQLRHSDRHLRAESWRKESTSRATATPNVPGTRTGPAQCSPADRASTHSYAPAGLRLALQMQRAAAAAVGAHAALAASGATSQCIPCRADTTRPSPKPAAIALRPGSR